MAELSLASRRPRSRASWATLGVVALALASTASAVNTSTAQDGVDPLDPLVRPAQHDPRAARAVLMGIARAGDGLVAVGENGVILLSRDGRQWRQGDAPVSVSLTSVHFVSATHGWAVGHSGVVLGTTDGGQTWRRLLDGRQIAGLPVEAAAAADSRADDPPAPTPSAGDPLLDVLFLNEREGFVVGAFGLMLHTEDGGDHWQRVSGRLPNPDGNHLYGLRRAGDRLVVVGERGAVYVSGDEGRHFRAAKTPYEGSFFGVAGQADGTMVAYGLQGRAFVSADQGANWREIGKASGAAWTGATTLGDGRMLLVNQAGEVTLQKVAAGAAAGDRGADSAAPAVGFALLPTRFAALSAVAQSATGDVVAVGPGGVQVIPMTTLQDESK